jgi:hypothetical protein
MTQTELKKIFLSSVLPVYLEEEGDKVVLYQGDKELTKLKTGEEIDSYLLEVYRTLISYD